MNVKRCWWSIVLFALAFTVGAAVPRQTFMPAMAADDKLIGRIAYTIESKDAKLKDVPVMVQVVKDGAVVWQGESKHGWSNTDNLPQGVYDVRFEGDGIKTLVKRGIRIQGAQTSIIAPIVAGQGAHIVEYAVGGMPREEVAARLMKLEAAVANLQKTR